MHGQGRDIGPDETRLNDNTLSWGSTSDEQPLPSMNFVERSYQESFRNDRMPTRQQGHMSYEILDESTNIPDAGGQRTAPSSRPQMHNGADYYKSEANRLSTFDGWRYQHIVRKEDLARNGFIYTGSADKVRCVFCNTALLRWDPGDVVEQEHRKVRVQCPFLQGDHVGNIPLHATANGYHQGAAAEPWSDLEKASSGGSVQVQRHYQSASTVSGQGAGSHHLGSLAAGTGSSAVGSLGPREHGYSSLPRNPTMAVEPDRLATFRFWPPQMTQKPEQLARCGLYYTGDGDRVRCFHCDVLLYNWEPGDDPYKEHARWCPDCEYIQLVKGEQFVDDIQNHRLTADDVMETPAVQALLFDGHSPQIIQKALAVLREKNIEADQVSAEKLLLTVMELDQPVEGSHGQSSTEGQSEDVQSLVRENESLREKQQCKICMEQDVEVIFYPCRHFVCCASCGAGISTCPICRVPIQSRDKVFMA